MFIAVIQNAVEQLPCTILATLWNSRKIPTNRRAVVKVKYLRGALRWSRNHIFHAPVTTKPWHYAAELCTFSVTYPLCDSAPSDTNTDNPSEMCPTKITDTFSSREDPCFLYHIHNLTGSHISPMAFTIRHDEGTNMLPQDERAHSQSDLLC